MPDLYNPRFPLYSANLPIPSQPHYFLIILLTTAEKGIRVKAWIRKILGASIKLISPERVPGRAWGANMDTTIVRRTGQAPLRIRGELLASNQSSANNARADYSGSTGRSQEVSVYRTASGKYVVAIHHNTCWQGEHDTDEASVFPSLNQCVAFLGDNVPGWMLQELIDELGEEAVAEEIA